MKVERDKDEKGTRENVREKGEGVGFGLKLPPNSNVRLRRFACNIIYGNGKSRCTNVNL